MAETFRQFTFAQPWWLLLFLLIPLAWILGHRRGVSNFLLFPSLHILGTLASRPKRRLWKLRPLLLPLAITPLVLALARPQLENEFENRTSSGVDIVIALDISYSMEIKDFILPDSASMRPIRRLEAAQEVIKSFVDGRPDDRIGLVTFAGRPYTASASTLDHRIIIEKLSEAATVQGEEGGTAIGSAISTASTRLDAITDSKSKVIVLVSDGESNSGQLGPVEAAKLSADLGIKIYPIAIGTTDGRLPNGVQVAPTQNFDVQTLQTIAEVTGGEFYRATDYSGLESAFQTINELEKTEIVRERYTVIKELYFWFVLAGAALLLIALVSELLRPEPGP